MVFFTGQTIYEYIKFQDGVPVQGTVTNIDRYRSGKHRRWRADITATIEGIVVKERVTLPRSGIKIGGVSVFASQISDGDTIELLAVPDGDSYDVAVADDVRNPWPELFWEVFTMALIGFSFACVVKKRL